jgi:muconate cycloisomerase
MRITRVEPIPVTLPLVRPLMMGGRRYEHSESLLVRIVCNDSAEGWGEAAPHGGERLSSLVAEVRDVIAPALSGHFFSRRAGILASFSKQRRCSPWSLAAVEIALSDAFARAHDLRVADLHGGAVRDSVAQKWLIGSPTVDEDLREAEMRRQQGVTFFMLKVGSKTIDQDVDLAKRLHRTYGNGIRLCADANGAWTLERALCYLDRVGEADLVYLEQPLAPKDLDDTARLARATKIPLSLDEALTGVADILAAYAAQATCGAVIKPSKYGGIGCAVQAGLLCEVLGLKVALATPMAESSLGTAAALQVASVLPQLDWEIAPSSDYLAADLVDAPIRHTNGRLAIPEGPGLGVKIEQRLVDAFRIDH